MRWRLPKSVSFGSRGRPDPSRRAGGWPGADAWRKLVNRARQPAQAGRLVSTGLSYRALHGNSSQTVAGSSTALGSLASRLRRRPWILPAIVGLVGLLLLSLRLLGVGAPAPTEGTMKNPTAGPAPAVGSVLVVANTDGLGVFIRGSPVMSDRIRAWPDGTRMVVVGPSRPVEGRLWRNVKDPDGTVGWIPSEYLVAESAAPASGSTASPTNR